MDRVRRNSIWIVGFCMALFHLWCGGVKPIDAAMMRAFHLGCGLVMIFYAYPMIKAKKDHPVTETQRQKTTKFMIDTALVLLTVISIGYYVVEFENLAYRGGMYNSFDVLFSVIGMLLVVEAARRTLGLAMPIIAMVFFLYAFIGPWLPGFLNHGGYSFTWVVCHVFLTTEGIFGVTLGASASYAFLFVLFAAALEITGGGEFFLKFAHGVCGRFRGGPAKVAVMGSGLMGMISGSAVANVAGTGCITIPMMKRLGLPPHEAGAVESVASSGGLIMPPVMGAAAFIMAEYLSVSYLEIMVAAALPALIYYVACFASVDFMSARLNMKGMPATEMPKIGKTIKEGLRFIIPLALLVYLIAGPQLTAQRSAFWGFVSMIVIHWGYRFAKKAKAAEIAKETAGILANGAKQACSIVAACACAGIVVGVVSLTSLGFSLSAMLVHLGDTSMLLLLIMTAVTSIILGMGLPVTACYILLAVLAAPALVGLGINPFAAHLFVLYYGVLSNITPPVALAAYVAAGISGSTPMKTAVAACRLGIVAFVVPFMFVYNPMLLLQGEITIQMLFVVVTSIIGAFGIAAGAQGYFLRRNKAWESAVLILSALCLLYPGGMSDIIGIAVVAGIFLIQWIGNKKETKAIA